MKTQFISIAFAGAFVLATTSALAQTEDEIDYEAYYISPFIGVSYGLTAAGGTNVEAGREANNNTAQQDRPFDAGYQVSAGARLGNYRSGFILGAVYNDFGEFSTFGTNNTRTEQLFGYTSYGGYVGYSNSWFGVQSLVRVGYHNWELEASQAADADGEDFFFGVEGGIHFGGGLDYVVGYDIYRTDSIYADYIEYLYVGLRYSLGRGY